jgi:nuclear cap-binding protein subunit 1
MDATTAASTVAMQYRPRGGIRLLPDGVDGSADGRLIIDRIVVEEFILDTLHWFDGDRRETVLRLGNLPVPFKYEAVLIETLFSQLLCLPMVSSHIVMMNRHSRSPDLHAQLS